MKTLIEQFVTQVLSSTENFTLTDGIHNITCTQFKRGQAIFVYGNVSGSYELNLNISAEKVTLRLYAIVREGQIYFYDLNCFGIYAGEDKQKLPKDCMTLKEYQELWKERQRQLIKEYQEEFLEGKLLREKIQGLKSVVININREKSNVILGKESKTVWGDDYIRDKLLGKTFVISPNSFYQVNHDQCERLYSKAMEYANLNKNETLLDLYCGVGTIGLTMAGSVKKLIGVEIVGKAIENAKINAKLNNIDNAEFICADAPTAAKKLEKEGIKADVIILDPPRKGCDASLFDTVCQMNPERIVYVSCDSSTLARDLKILDEKGYKTKRVCAVDMFPRTPHVEAVALIEKL